MTEYDSVLAAAVKMPVGDQLRLIDELAAALSDDQPPSLSPQWLAEIERRTSELDAGQVTPESWPQVRQRLFKQVGLSGAD